MGVTGCSCGTHRIPQMERGMKTSKLGLLELVADLPAARPVLAIQAMLPSFL